MSFKVKLFFADLLLEPQLQVSPVSAEAEKNIQNHRFNFLPKYLSCSTPKEANFAFPSVTG
jgi:hypothetical protein